MYWIAVILGAVLVSALAVYWRQQQQQLVARGGDGQLPRHPEGPCVDYSARAAWPSYREINVFPSPAFSVAFRARIIAAAEVVAAARGGFTTKRHVAYPTTDLPVDDIPAIAADVHTAMYTDIFPQLAYMAGVRLEDLCPHVDAFVVKYDAVAQRQLAPHEDGSTFTFTMLLNDTSEFIGGGTRFVDSVPPRTVCPDNTVVLAHYGKLRHEGVPITAGKRYLLVGFVRVRDDCDAVGDDASSSSSSDTDSSSVASEVEPSEVEPSEVEPSEVEPSEDEAREEDAPASVSSTLRVRFADDATAGHVTVSQLDDCARRQ